MLLYRINDDFEFFLFTDFCFEALQKNERTVDFDHKKFSHQSLMNDILKNMM